MAQSVMSDIQVTLFTIDIDWHYKEPCFFINKHIMFVVTQNYNVKVFRL